MIFGKGKKGRDSPAETSPSTVYGGHTAAVRAPYGPIRAVREIYGESTEKTETVRSWMEKFPEVQRFERGRPLKRAIMAGAVVAAVWSVYTGRPARGSILLGLVAMASLIGFDAFHFFARTLADTSRALISASLLVWAAVTCWPVKANIIIAGAVTGITVIYVLLFNVKALAAQVYRRSPSVKKALAKSQPAPVEELYQMTGAAMVRTIQWELGVSVDEIQAEVLKAVWVCGFSLSSHVTDETLAETDLLWKKNARLEAQLAERDELIDATVEFYQNKELYDARILGLENELRERDARFELARKELRDYRLRAVAAEEQVENKDKLLQEQAEQMIAMEAQLTDLQAELAETSARLQELEPPAQITAIPAKSVEELLAEAVAQGYGVDKMMRYAGVTHHKAQQYYTAHKDEVLAARRALAEKEA